MIDNRLFLDNVLFIESLFFPGARERGYRLLNLLKIDRKNRHIPAETRAQIIPLIKSQVLFCSRLKNGEPLMIEPESLSQSLIRQRTLLMQRLIVIRLRADEPVPPPEEGT